MDAAEIDPRDLALADAEASAVRALQARDATIKELEQWKEAHRQGLIFHEDVQRLKQKLSRVEDENRLLDLALQNARLEIKLLKGRIKLLKAP